MKHYDLDEETHTKLHYRRMVSEVKEATNMDISIDGLLKDSSGSQIFDVPDDYFHVDYDSFLAESDCTTELVLGTEIRPGMDFDAAEAECQRIGRSP